MKRGFLNVTRIQNISDFILKMKFTLALALTTSYACAVQFAPPSKSGGVGFGGPSLASKFSGGGGGFGGGLGGMMGGMGGGMSSKFS